ncbi:MAG: D-alanyl-D-alanine carboxypeptidase/D-alanyl-D-alanine-endopeptidase [Opitutae bacterium]|nr:D-alanyl-D-alanine carboxypeptidase/D-alanyl-D-alanine-endopeptidase [Opitutae bacterium]
MRILLRLAVLLTFALLARAEEFDLIIRHGRVVDGSGNPSFAADVAVKDGRIVRIGRIDGTAVTEIDATGLVVAPGFIDVHTHADEIADKPLAENFLRMGVTSIVVGNCGGSALDVGKFYADVERNKVALNVATLIGHNTVREAAMGGSFDRVPTAEEMARMKSLVDRAMRDGAVGLSTGLIYLPGTFSKTDEIVELAKAVTPYDGIYASHMRHEDTRIYAALDEVFRVAREARLRAEVSHLKLSGETAWGQAGQVLAHIEAARAGGLDITHDQYAYTASSTTMRQLIPDDAFAGGHDGFLAVLADPVQKAGLVARMKKNILGRGRMDYAYAVVASFRHDTSLNGLNILEAAKKSRGSDSLDDQIEVILDFEKNGGAAGVFHGMNEEDLREFMRHPNTMVASDSGLREFGKDAPHPRGYGNNARVLGRYVRELKVLRLEDAIRKMTSLPAATFRFTGRGLLREGHWADIVAFDPEKIGDPATYRDPHHYAAGIPHVLVNGVPVVRDGEHTGAKPGLACRAGADKSGDLAARLEALVTQPRFAGAFWGVKVVSLDSGRTLFAHGADRRMSPASNCKLYAGALALDQLGGDHRIRTPLRATAGPDQAGVLAGDLIVSGRGDPGWNHRVGKRDFWTSFEPFVAALQRAGVKKITGDIVADATWLRVPPHGASWTVDDMDYEYGAEVSAISLADNYVDLRITPAAKEGQPCAIEVLQPLSGLGFANHTVTGEAGGPREIRVQRLPGEGTVHVFGTLPVGGKEELTEAPVPQPAAWFARALREALTKAGIAVAGRARSVRWPDAPVAGEVLIGEVTSAPLRELVAGFMLPSQNLETDLIFAHLGELRRTPTTPAWARSDELAVTALDEFMARLGVPGGAVLFDEGSGLSRNNLATAAATASLLQAMARHRESAGFLAALPTAGVSGSLDKRMRGTPAENNVRAKTGTLRYASSLSGYVTTAAGERLAFSAMLNRYPVPAKARAGDPLDELAVILARHDRR